jgi:thiol:disulfide interchange protein
MKRKALILLLFFSILTLHAQIYDPVSWTFELKKSSSTEAELHLKAKIEAPWHLYDQKLPEGGPVSTTFTFSALKGVKRVGEVYSLTKPHEEFDKTFSMNLRWFTKEVTFVQKLTLEAGKEAAVDGEVRFMACDDESCLPPTSESFHVTAQAGNEPAAAKPASVPSTSIVPNIPAAIPTAVAPSAQPADADSVVAPSALSANDLWTPVFDQWGRQAEENTPTSFSWLFIFFAGFAGGLLALFTPCVWPIIPMTVSFFLKRPGGKGRSEAFLYGISIIVIYLLLGLLITLLFGASALNSLSTNAFFNLFFFALLILFAVSFFGAFDITLPSSWSNAIDSKASKTSGVLSIFLMAFTLVLVSFSCTGPIIGTLLVEVSSTGSLLSPAIGMIGFALALSIPFSLFALFPSWLKSAPKSGGWLNSVKVVLGFLELALALKFFSVADLAYGWGLLDREVFLVLWIVIFAFLGFYLIGKIRFSHDSELQSVSVPRFFMALISFAFALYMIPGLWGAPLRSISAFAPPLYTQDFSLYDDEVHAPFSDFEAGMSAAAREGKPVMIDFSGYGCVNCRKMENAVWIDPGVKQRLTEEYVLITLMVDDKTELAAPIAVTENGKNRTLRTVGDKWSYLQRIKFGANAQPFYVLLDNNGKPLSKPYSYNENIDKYIQFLDNGLKAYRARK